MEYLLCLIIGIIIGHFIPRKKVIERVEVIKEVPTMPVNEAAATVRHVYDPLTRRPRRY